MPAINRAFVIYALLAWLTWLHGSSWAQSSTTIPFTLSPDKNIVFSATLNDVDAVQLMLHTAASEVTLTTEASKKCASVKYNGTTKARAWGGQSESRYGQSNKFQLGDLAIPKLTIWEDIHSGKGTDGKFGLDIFGKKIIELNFDQRLLIVHDRLPEKASQYQSLDMENDDGQLFIRAACGIADQRYTHRFLIHTGYAGGVLLDDEFVQANQLDDKITITEETSLKDSFGNVIKVKKGKLPEIRLGELVLTDIPVGFFSGKLGNQSISLIGCEVLTRCNLIFDIENHHLWSAKAQP